MISMAAVSRNMPEFLTGLRACAEIFADSAPGSFQQVLVTEYSPGAGIGRHKDRSVFGDVVGISLISPCTFRLLKRSRLGFERQTLIAAPQRGPARALLHDQRRGSRLRLGLSIAVRATGGNMSGMTP